MFNRHFLRAKVLQSLYAYITAKNAFASNSILSASEKDKKQTLIEEAKGKLPIQSDLKQILEKLCNEGAFFKDENDDKLWRERIEELITPMLTAYADKLTDSLMVRVDEILKTVDGADLKELYDNRIKEVIEASGALEYTIVDETIPFSKDKPLPKPKEIPPLQSEILKMMNDHGVFSSNITDQEELLSIIEGQILSRFSAEDNIRNEDVIKNIYQVKTDVYDKYIAIAKHFHQRINKIKAEVFFTKLKDCHILLDENEKKDVGNLFLSGQLFESLDRVQRKECKERVKDYFVKKEIVQTLLSQIHHINSAVSPLLAKARKEALLLSIMEETMSLTQEEEDLLLELNTSGLLFENYSREKIRPIVARKMLLHFTDQEEDETEFAEQESQEQTTEEQDLTESENENEVESLEQLSSKTIERIEQICKSVEIGEKDGKSLKRKIAKEIENTDNEQVFVLNKTIEDLTKEKNDEQIFLITTKEDLAKQEKEMFDNLDSCNDLCAYYLSALLYLRTVEDDIIEEARNKHFATQQEKNPDKRLIENPIFDVLENDKVLQGRIRKNKIDWLENEGIFRQILKQFKTPSAENGIYKKYMGKKPEELTFEDHKKVIVSLFKKIRKNKDLCDLIAEKNLSWESDSDYMEVALTMALDRMTDKTETLMVFDDSIYKKGDMPESGADFMSNLFENTAEHWNEYDELIEKYTINREMERTALMDILTIKMAISEFLYSAYTPLSISFNEYILLAKEFSTPKSSVFVNGILAKIATELRESGRIRKISI